MNTEGVVKDLEMPDNSGSSRWAQYHPLFALPGIIT